MSDKRFTTDEIVATVMKWRGWDMDAVDEPAYREIIDRLRAADKLCEAAKECHLYLPVTSCHRLQARNPKHSRLSRAIADYNGKEE